MELRRGYKQTDVGVIPEDWDVKIIDEIGYVTSGKRLPLGSALVEHPTPYPYIRVTDMRPGTVSLSDIKFVPESVSPAIKRYRIFRDDIFISVAGTLGIVGKVPPELDGANLTENADRITDIKCSQDFLLYVLMSPLIQNTINSIRTVGAQPKLALTRLRQFAIPLPLSEVEQRAIAVALSDVDALLDGLDRLVAKKRDLKQAAMQQLLTGQTRLSGFHSEWEMKRLGDLGVFLKGGGITKDQATGGSLACVRYGELYTRHNNVIRDFFSWISPEVAVTATRLRSGDLLFAGSGETKEEIGKCAAFVDEREAYAGGDIIVFRPNGADSVFLGYLLNSASINRQKASHGQGDAVVHINARALAAICCRIPEPREQAAIAALLYDMDAELAALEARRNKTHDLKQAMVQELLTGRTRLIEPEIQVNSQATA